MSDETGTTTLAERLLELLEAGRSKGRQDQAAGKVWAEILGVEHDSPEYLRLVADINKMIADLVQLVSDSRMREPAKQNYKKTPVPYPGWLPASEPGQALANHAR